MQVPGGVISGNKLVMCIACILQVLCLGQVGWWWLKSPIAPHTRQCMVYIEFCSIVLHLQLQCMLQRTKYCIDSLAAKHKPVLALGQLTHAVPARCFNTVKDILKD